LKDLAKLKAKLKPSLSNGMEEYLAVALTSSADSMVQAQDDFH